MPDYSKVCWYCGKKAMEPVGTYFQCRECGATWNEVPAPKDGGVEVVRDTVTGGTSYTVVPFRRATQRRARRLPKSQGF